MDSKTSQTWEVRLIGLQLPGFSLSPFFNAANTLAFFQSSGTMPVLNEWLKIIYSGTLKLTDVFTNNSGTIPSAHGACNCSNLLKTFSLSILISFIMPSILPKYLCLTSGNTFVESSHVNTELKKMFSMLHIPKSSVTISPFTSFSGPILSLHLELNLT